MTGIEVTLILIGVIFLLGSFFVAEKLSDKELNKIAELSEKEIKTVAERELSRVSGELEDKLDDLVVEAVAHAESSMDKETNQKILEIGEYSDTVLTNMNKTHNEIMFLYGMLNDKHTELTELAGEAASLESKLGEKIEESKAEIELEEELAAELVIPAVDTVSVEEHVESVPEGNHNDMILSMYRQGKLPVEIAKELGLGIGEVNLVLGLFRGETKSETEILS